MLLVTKKMVRLLANVEAVSKVLNFLWLVVALRGIAEKINVTCPTRIALFRYRLVRSLLVC